MTSKNRTLAFAIAATLTASLNIPEDQYQKAIAETKEALQAVQNDTDGELWGLAVSNRHNINESSYRLLESCLEECPDDLEGAALLALTRAISTGLRKEYTEDLQREGLSRVQVSFKVTPKSDTITNEKEAK